MKVVLLKQGEFVIKDCILSYPHIFEARRAGPRGRETGDPRFSGDFILPADITQADLGVLQQLWQDAIAYKWGNNPPALPACFQIQARVSPWKDASQADPKLAGRYRLAASSRHDSPPRVLQQVGPGMYEALEDKTKIFAGCIVNAHLRFFGFDTGGNGISCGLQGVLLVDNTNVERLDNRTDSADAFAAAEGAGGQPSGYPAPTAPPPQANPAGGVPAAHQVQGGAPVAPGAPMPGVQQASDDLDFLS